MTLLFLGRKEYNSLPGSNLGTVFLQYQQMHTDVLLISLTEQKLFLPHCRDSPSHRNVNHLKRAKRNIASYFLVTASQAKQWNTTRLFGYFRTVSKRAQLHWILYYPYGEAVWQNPDCSAGAACHLQAAASALSPPLSITNERHPSSLPSRVSLLGTTPYQLTGSQLSLQGRQGPV